jgi:asparagine N-glycosylation enzyme membrane subunit Stt3
MEATDALVNCGFTCKFEWIELSSNFFDISVYAPAALAVLFGVLIYRVVKRKQGSEPNGKK